MNRGGDVDEIDSGGTPSCAGREIGGNGHHLVVFFCYCCCLFVIKKKKSIFQYLIKRSSYFVKIKEVLGEIKHFVIARNK